MIYRVTAFEGYQIAREAAFDCADDAAKFAAHWAALYPSVRVWNENTNDVILTLGTFGMKATA